MLKITVGTNTNRKTVMATEDTTLRQCLEENGINSVSYTHLTLPTIA